MVNLVWPRDLTVATTPNDLRGLLGSRESIQQNELYAVDVLGAAMRLVRKATVDENTVGVGAALQIKANGAYAHASNTADTLSPCTALALEAGAGADKLILQVGRITNGAWTWVTGPGSAGLVYLGAAGALTQTPPGSPLFRQVLGYAESATTLMFVPNLSMVKVA